MSTGQLPISISSSGDNTIIPGAVGSSIQVLSITLSLASEATVQFKTGSTPLSGPQTMLSAVLDSKTNGAPWFVTARGEAFVLALGSSVQCGGTVWFQYVS